MQKGKAPVKNDGTLSAEARKFRQNWTPPPVRNPVNAAVTPTSNLLRLELEKELEDVKLSYNNLY